MILVLVFLSLYINKKYIETLKTILKMNLSTEVFIYTSKKFKYRENLYYIFVIICSICLLIVFIDSLIRNNY